MPSGSRLLLLLFPQLLQHRFVLQKELDIGSERCELSAAKLLADPELFMKRAELFQRRTDQSRDAPFFGRSGEHNPVDVATNGLDGDCAFSGKFSRRFSHIRF